MQLVTCVALVVTVLLPVFLTGCGGDGPYPAPTPTPKPNSPTPVPNPGYPTPQPTDEWDREVVTPPDWPKPKDKGFPLSFGIKANGLVYASGMQGVNLATGKLVDGGVAKETKQALTLLSDLLAAAGSSMDKVISCSVSLININRDFKDMNDAYSKFWPTAPPSRITVEVSALAGNANVEIMCLAADSKTDRTPVGAAPGGFPLSPAIKSGGVVYVSGMQGREKGELVPGGVASQTTKALSAIDATLKKANSSLALAIGCEVYLDNLADFAAMNKAYANFWPQGGFPSRISVQAGIAGGGAVEIRCLAATSSIKHISSVPGWTPLTGFPLSFATISESVVYVSGMQGMDPTTMKRVQGGIANETTQALNNVADILSAHGSAMEAVIECEVSLASMNEFAAMNKAYAAFWPYAAPPSRVAVQVGSLAGGARVEIKCTAATDPDPSTQKTSVTV